MLENKQFYLSLENITEGMFVPRPEALQYHDRDSGEKALLKFIEDSFQFDEGEISEPTGPTAVTVFSESVQENEIPST